MFFDEDEVEAVRVCFGSPLPDPVVERVLELRVVRREWIDDIGRRRIEFYKDGERHGKWEWWYKNGREECERHYRKGKLHGECRGWYESGKPEYMQYYGDGIQQGKCTWSEFGTLICTSITIGE